MAKNNKERKQEKEKKDNEDELINLAVSKDPETRQNAWTQLIRLWNS